MVEPDTHRDALLRTWRERGIDGDTLAADERGTIGRRDDAIVASALGPAPGASLPPVRFGEHELVELGPVIGRGGMGVVRLARQPALLREVAVKELPPQPPPEAVAALVREAWVAGNLEHPNVVPIHALCASEAGDPLLIMKRIEGTPWSAALADPAVARSLGASDPFEWHLDVLTQLCRAVEYAHARGIVHLDLKPSNVMVGAFGEVYLLDWGVAASVREDALPWLPRAREIRTVCGTPAYMAPEVASGEGPRIGPRTDLFMLGAILHEVVTGRKRYEGASLADRLVAAYAAEPFDYGADVAPGLAAICRRATARDPDDRHASVAELRRALRDHRAHRASDRLVAAARERAERLLRVAPGEPGAADALDDPALERAWIECRFGLEQAREAWPENPAVPDTLQSLLETLVARALRDGRLDRAAAWLAELPQRVPVLEERLAELRAREKRAETRRRALERLEHENDLNVHRAARVRYAVLGALVWLSWNLGSAVLFRTELLPLTHPILLLGGGGTLLVYGFTVWLFRNSILRTDVNRRILGLYGAGLACTVLAWGVCWAFAVDPLTTVALSFPFYVNFGVAAALAVDRRLIGPTLLLLPFGVLLLVVPERPWEILGAGGAVFALAAAWIWRRPRPAGRLSDRSAETITAGRAARRL